MEREAKYAWRVVFNRDWRESVRAQVAEVVIVDEPMKPGEPLPESIERTIKATYPEATVWSGECVGPVLPALSPESNPEGQ